MRSLLPCAPMYFAVEAVARALTAASVPNLVSVVVQIVVGGIVYIIGAFVFCRPGAQEVVRLARATLQRRRRS